VGTILLILQRINWPNSVQFKQEKQKAWWYHKLKNGGYE